MPGDHKLSPIIQALIDKGLFERLPPTFSTFFFEQFQDWDLLFPAERNYQERLFSLLDRSDPQAVESLLARLRQIELQMGVNEKTWPRRRFTLEQVDFLNRNPHYQEWRRAIVVVFSKLDPLLDGEIAHPGRPRLVIVTTPDLPAGPERTWLRLQGRGKRIALEVPEGQDYLGLILSGGGERSIAELYSKEPYDSWVISANRSVAKGGVKFSYDQLKDYRSRLMSEMHRLVEVEKVPGPRQLEQRLKQLKLWASEGDFANDAILAEFVRAVLLIGNGTLLINNTFVEWATMQAIRRARPSLAIISFGVRNKLKPFSSMLVHTDQETASPVPAQMDTLGTYVDLEIFYQYIWQEFERHAEYRNNTAYLFVADGMDELLCIAPSDFPLLAVKTSVKLEQVFSCAKEWLNV
jgi:hypothetical protein